MTDSSNLSREYTRNRLRLEVLPVLEELNPSFLEAVARMTDTLSQDSACLEAQAQALLEACRGPWGLDAVKLRQAHPAVASRALRLFWQGWGPALEKKHLDALLPLPGGGPGGLARRDAGPVLPGGALPGAAGRLSCFFPWKLPWALPSSPAGRSWFCG